LTNEVRQSEGLYRTIKKLVNLPVPAFTMRDNWKASCATMVL